MTSEQERLAVLEVQLKNLDSDLHEIKDDVREIKHSIETAHAGLTRSEKIALTASGAAVFGAILGVVALLTGSPA